MKTEWRRFAPWGLYLALLAAIVSVGLYIVLRDFSLPLQISLALIVVGLAAFAILDPDRVRSGLTGRQARYGSNALVLAIAVIGIIVVINYLVYQNSQRWDLTENQQFTLAEESLATLDQLKQSVKALAFYTPRMASFSQEQVEGLLDQYRFNSDGMFDYEFINPEEEPIRARDANVTRDGTVVLQMGDRQEQLTTVEEREVTGALVRLLSPNSPAVYFLTGHGEFSPDETGDRAYSQVKDTLENKNYTVSTLNLLAENRIPEDAQVVVVAGPVQPVSQTEVDMLAAFVQSGGSLIVMEEPLPLTDFEVGNDPLADYLSQDWGIQYGNDLVVDLTSNQPFLAVANQYGQHVITDKMQGLVSFFPTARSVTVQGDAPEAGITDVELVNTAQQSWAETDLEAFSNSAETGAAPEINPDEGVDLLGPVSLAVVGDNSTTGGRVAVFGDAEFASDTYFTQFGNGDLFVNTVDWAAEQEQLINLTPKENTPRVLIPPQGYTMNLILLGTVFILPGAVLLSGIVVWAQRRRRG